MFGIARLDTEVDADRVIERTAFGLVLRDRSERLGRAEKVVRRNACNGVTNALAHPLDESGFYVAAHCLAGGHVSILRL